MPGVRVTVALTRKGDESCATHDDANETMLEVHKRMLKIDVVSFGVQ